MQVGHASKYKAEPLLDNSYVPRVRLLKRDVHSVQPEQVLCFSQSQLRLPESQKTRDDQGESA